MFKKRKISLRWQALLAALASLVLAVGFFFAIRATITAYLNYNPTLFETFNQSQNTSVLNRFEEFAADNEISSTDLDEIDQWLNFRMVSLEMVIVKDDTVIYNSNLYKYEVAASSSSFGSESYTLTTNESLYYQTSSYYVESGYFGGEVSLSDGDVEVYIYADYAYQLYVAMIVGEIFLAALAFSIFFVLMINHKIKYISQLEGEVRMLETGGLEYPITEKGNDELAGLASGLNHLRVELSNNIEKEEEAMKANYELVAAVSHDLRTPLTSLTLYLDMLNSGKITDEQQQKEYIKKCHDKVNQISRMTDQLFDRFLLASRQEKKITASRKVRAVFEEPLSNFICFLEAKEFKIEISCQWPDERLIFDFDDLNRILDNIASNIIKYADVTKPVIIDAVKKEQYFIIRFSNAIAAEQSSTSSSKVGVVNIIKMMENNGGKCLVEMDENNYTIELDFILKEQEDGS